MKLSSWLKKLEKKKIISRKPHPIIPFIMSFFFILIGNYALNQNLIFFRDLSYVLAVLTFIFAIIHLIVVINLKDKKPKIPSSSAENVKRKK